jgi:hexosaminidase
MVLLILATAAAAVSSGVWPPPQQIATSGSPVQLALDFTATAPFTTTPRNSPRLVRAIDRFNSLMAPRRRVAAAEVYGDATSSISGLDVEVAVLTDEVLNTATDYSYTLEVGGGRATVTAHSIYGAMYGLETFTQLVDSRGMLTASTVRVSDAPDHPWRGLLVDSGRRFATVALLRNIIDTMAAVKLNCLHLHASDFCRFGVESKLYPNLVPQASGPNAGFYTHEDIKGLIEYAGDRGVRLV